MFKTGIALCGLLFFLCGKTISLTGINPLELKMGIFDFLKNKPKSTDIKSVDRALLDKDELKANLDNIQDEIFRFLKPLGFRKKGRAFNRQTEDGIYQVIDIQSGRVHGSLYGSFTINLGIMVKEIYLLEPYNKPKEFYQESNCNIRERLPMLTVKKDHWWAISDAPEATAKEIVADLQSKGIKWLDDLGTREKIVNNWEQMADSNSPRAKLDVAITALTLDIAKGGQLMAEYYRKIKNSDAHKNYVKALAEKLGVPLT